MLPRLDAIEDDLRSRRARAETEQWLGEIEGIDIALTRLAGKRDQAQRIAATGPVLLGMPASRTATSEETLMATAAASHTAATADRRRRP